MPNAGEQPSLQSFFPSIELARAAIPKLSALRGFFGKEIDLWQHAPREERKLAAIVFLAQALRRSRWSKPIELSKRLYDRYPRGEPSVPVVLVDQSYHCLLDGGIGSEQKCTRCSVMKSGWAACDICTGTGKVSVTTIDEGAILVDCTHCEAGLTRCTTCEGTGRSVRADVHFIEDKTIAIRRTYFPTLPAAIVKVLRAHIDATLNPPACLEFDAQPALVESAYRGAATVRVPDFHGHGFGGALEQVLAGKDELGRFDGLVKEQLWTFGWPLSWLVYEVGGETIGVALFMQSDGSIAAAVAPERGEGTFVDH
jgi:hypothetical protein